MNKTLVIILVVIGGMICTQCTSTKIQNEYLTKPFIHPGMYQSAIDLEYMREMVQKEEEPWKTAYENLKKQTSLDFVVNPVAYISVGAYGANSIGGREYGQGGGNAYNNALMWYITKDRSYANKAIEILDAWASTLRAFDGNNAKLNVALTGSEYLNAAEIIRHTGARWSDNGIEQFKRSIRTVFHPTIEDFFTEANGNWDGGMINTMMCMGVFLDDHDIFNRAVERYFRGQRNSGVFKYVYPGGQCQESTRDWDHVQLGLGEFAKAAQVGDTYGIDFYGAGNHRLAQGMEQCAKYMLDKQDIDMYGVMQHRANGRIRDIYETVYSHYLNKRGILLVYTEEAARATRDRSSTGVLTTIKATNGEVRDPGGLSIPDFLKASQTGALLHAPASPAPAASLTVMPGDEIQTVIDANKGTDKWIILAAGVHDLEKPLIMYSGITLAGEGRATILHLARGVNTETMVNGESTMENVTVRDMIIEGASATVENNDPNADRRSRMYMNAPSREGIVFRSGRGGTMKNITFENLTVQNFTKNGIFIADGENVVINSCDISDNGGNVVPGEKFHHNLFISYSKNTKITRSRFDASPYGHGIFIKFCNGVEILNCETARNKLAGIRCTESQNLTVNDNLIEGNESNGLSIDAMMDGCSHVTVRNNIAQGNTGYGVFFGKVASLNAQNNLTLHNNVN